MFSRYTISVFIDRKFSKCVIDKLMLNWVGIFGVMRAVFFDNGGEFTSDEIKEVASQLNVQIMTTGAQSPFQNGLNERNHSVVDNMLAKMDEDFPRMSQDVKLAWACMAKNTLQMWHGYSSAMIVFGTNPKLPNVMTEELPALQGRTSSETFAEHLNALHSARRAFIQSEADERLRRALRCKMRASEEKYENGDRVYYLREGQKTWLGPAKVLFQDGKVIFLRHGSSIIQVSANRLQHVEAGIQRSDEEEENSSNPTVVSEVENGTEEEVGGDVAAVLPNENDAVEEMANNEQEVAALPNENGAVEEMAGDEQDVIENIDRDERVPVVNRRAAITERIQLKRNDIIEFTETEGEDPQIVQITGRAVKSTAKKNFNWGIKHE